MTQPHELLRTAADNIERYARWNPDWDTIVLSLRRLADRLEKPTEEMLHAAASVPMHYSVMMREHNEAIILAVIAAAGED